MDTCLYSSSKTVVVHANMRARNAIDVFDPEVARSHTRAELRSKYGQIDVTKITVSESTRQKIQDAANEERRRMVSREEERRKRDPTYRPDALELSGTILPFDRHVDYYARLEVDQFASALEIKRAYMALSLQLHPDKQVGRDESEVEAAKDRFSKMVEAFEVLGDLPTRRAYDQARDQAEVREIGRAHV